MLIRKTFGYALRMASKIATSISSTRPALWWVWYVLWWPLHVLIDVEEASKFNLEIGNGRRRSPASVVMALTYLHLCKAVSTSLTGTLRVTFQTTGSSSLLQMSRQTMRRALIGSNTLISIPKSVQKESIEYWCTVWTSVTKCWRVKITWNQRLWILKPLHCEKYMVKKKETASRTRLGIKIYYSPQECLLALCPVACRSLMNLLLVSYKACLSASSIYFCQSIQVPDSVIPCCHIMCH